MSDTNPPMIVDGERETLTAFLGYLRQRIVAKLEGLSDRDARRELVASGTSLLWLVKHLTAVEGLWFRHVLAGEPPEVITHGELSDDDTLASVIAGYREAVARSEEIAAGCDDLDQRAATVPAEREPVSLRWILVHMIEEVARHAGHADILREQIDGTVGR